MMEGNKQADGTTVARSTSAATGETSIESERWLKSLNNAIPAIVVIRVNCVRAFDGGGASYSHATGFIVDKVNGYILTNRHVVTPGPVIADAIFVNKEEVDLRAVYRDPVHDFGFFKFDPKKVNFLELNEISMAPEEAKIGAEIRVVGNDAGEKLSILPGILAKLDRDAPNYGSREYNDFNTFYYAAASSTSGGSSGSPVLNIEGKAVALNAGGAKKSASSFYLPLDRAVRALGYIQRNHARASPPSVSTLVPRGTLQTIFRHCAFDEVRRLGLTSDMEGLIRSTFPLETGALVVNQVVPSSCAHEQLLPGDVLVRFNHEIQTTFIPIEEYLDEHVGDIAHVEIQRGGKTHAFEFIVEDLHSITPDRFLEISGGVVHALSYQQAKNASLAVGSVFLAQAGHMMIKAGVGQWCIITSVGKEATPTLDDFIRIVSNISDGKRTFLKYFFVHDRHRIRTAVITMDRQWFPMQIYHRCDEDGLWHATCCEEPHGTFCPEIPQVPPTPLKCHNSLPLACRPVLQALVLVSFDIPYMVDGISSSCYTGAGIIFDKARGLVLVDRNTVPTALGDVLITVAASLEIPGQVIFVHPIHNYSILTYDVALLGATEVDEITIGSNNDDCDEDNNIRVGNQLQYIGLTHGFTVVTQNPQVTKIDRLVLRECQPPRYRATNVEVVHFDRVTKSVGGVFVNNAGKTLVLWLSFSYQDDGGRKEVFRGLPVKVIRPVIESFKSGTHPPVCVLPVQLSIVSLAKARSGMGLPDHWAQKLELCHDDRRQVLSVKRCCANSDAKSKLESGDLILAVNDQVVSKDFDLERLSVIQNQSEIQLKVFRDHQELEFPVQLTNLLTRGTERLVVWSGLVIQEPHYSVLSLSYLPEEGGGVYVSRWCYGSPAHKYGLRATIWITEVNDEPTPDIDTFLKIVATLEDGGPVRIKTRDLSTKLKVFTLKTDYHYWPSFELFRSTSTNSEDEKTRKWKFISHVSYSSSAATTTRT